MWHPDGYLRTNRSRTMNPQSQFCHNPDCPARGQVGKGNIIIHSQKKQRYQCTICKDTFTATKGTPFYRLHTSMDVVTLVLTLGAHSLGAWLPSAGDSCSLRL